MIRLCQVMYVSPQALDIHAPGGMPEVGEGDDLADLVIDAFLAAGKDLVDDDVLVVAQKIVSKSEGREVELAQVEVSDAAMEIALETGKDARLVELILRESTKVVRRRKSLLITEHRLGMIMANAGVDRSNVNPGCALLLPVDPDGSAERLRTDIYSRLHVRVGVIIADSFGRAWRRGITGQAIGVAGIESVVDLRGKADRHGNKLEVTEIAVADEIAGAATLVMGQAGEGRPVVRIRGFHTFERNNSAGDILRPVDEDLFR